MILGERRGETNPPRSPTLLECSHVDGLASDGLTRTSHVAAWIAEHKMKFLNVAGNRESKAPGIGLKGRAVPGRRVPLAGAQDDLNPPCPTLKTRCPARRSVREGARFAGSSGDQGESVDPGKLGCDVAFP